MKNLSKSWLLVGIGLLLYSNLAKAGTTQQTANLSASINTTPSNVAEENTKQPVVKQEIYATEDNQGRDKVEVTKQVSKNGKPVTENPAPQSGLSSTEDDIKVQKPSGLATNFNNMTKAINDASIVRTSFSGLISEGLGDNGGVQTSPIQAPLSPVKSMPTRSRQGTHYQGHSGGMAHGMPSLTTGSLAPVSMVASPKASSTEASSKVATSGVDSTAKADNNSNNNSGLSDASYNDSSPSNANSSNNNPNNNSNGNNSGNASSVKSNSDKSSNAQPTSLAQPSSQFDNTNNVAGGDTTKKNPAKKNIVSKSAATDDGFISSPTTTSPITNKASPKAQVGSKSVAATASDSSQTNDDAVNEELKNYEGISHWMVKNQQTLLNFSQAIHIRHQNIRHSNTTIGLLVIF